MCEAQVNEFDLNHVGSAFFTCLINFNQSFNMNHKVSRTDISEWVIHFIHEKGFKNGMSPIQDIYELEGGTGEVRHPDYYDSEGHGRCILTSYDEKEYMLPEYASAFQVLLKILHDGFLHAGWSYRNGCPTIYGPRSAVCFTEMPLHAFLKYADDRGEKTGLISKYAIALQRNELFQAGGRQVIYGLSVPHVESDGFETGVYQGRCLSIRRTGLGLKEQYRYVATRLDSEKFIDWTHEREWRWPLPDDELGVPGLPLFLDEPQGRFFSEILVFVESVEEKTEVLNFLKSLYDSGSWNNGMEYDIEMIKRVKVMSLEEILQIEDINMSMVKIENLPFSIISVMPTFHVTSQTREMVAEKLEQSIVLADEAMISFCKENKELANQEFDWGWTYICTEDVSEITQALVELGFSSYADGVYRKNIITRYRHSLTTQQVGAEVAAEFLTKELGQEFFVMSHPD